MTQDAARAPSEADWAAIGAAPFVLLGTYRKTGELVSVPVWIAPDGDALVVTSERETGKVKRLRRDPRVLLQPCGRAGKPAPEGPVVMATGRILGAADEHPAAGRALRAKYGWQYGAILGVERFVRRVQRRAGDRVILRIERLSAEEPPER
ncbi:PPOX class F420-dependent oxidoreductase [Microbacterium sp. SORGH_AS_0888]|uniref:PPOX class F420-dependent oxidoreductase n=1 Tax=Microbacterium sp. SORGH_AS_0888 TaxID=3041791 RepID=UPI002788D732|nr:PPOX class F420-dependent oxidoreductase [Microbacterium sp. SORGH_AS_0888]MDQ1130117.1 PPOX class probable F420-dependent enzyme [Microbacterium sp. SORGH_AS_0888]